MLSFIEMCIRDSTTVEHALQNVGKYPEALRQSPLNEMSSLMNALNGGFTAPSPGGDLIVNPNTRCV